MTLALGENKNKMKRLENKVAVVYGDGTTGGAIAKAFAREGARCFLTGRTVTKLDAIADEILSGGGAIETAQLNALDEQAVDKHMAETIRKAGKVDISFNAIGIPKQANSGNRLLNCQWRAFRFHLYLFAVSLRNRKSCGQTYGEARVWGDYHAYPKPKQDKCTPL